ncbi:MAG TPA: hypothetical protein VJ783_25955 [Pirellulales bacterium]|nr:hypothetical protein [Pirellulales bacterium]
MIASLGRWMVFPGVVLAVLAAAGEAQAGLIVSVQVDGAGMSAAERQGDGSRAERAGSAGDHLLDLSGGALPTSSGSSSSTISTTAGSSAVLPQMCGLPSPASFAGLCEERALRLPASPLFDHLRPPRA